MEITEAHEGDIIIFKLSGRLDSNTSPDFDQRISHVINDGRQRLVFDFSALDYITSAGLRVLNKTAKKLQKVDGKLVICEMADYIREVFEIAGFDLFLPIVKDLEGALQTV